MSFIQQHAFDIHPHSYMYEYSVPFYYPAIFDCMDITSFDYSFTVEGYLSCFQFVAVVNRAIISICIPVFYEYTFFYLG